jgi:hypothetical protein
MNDCTVRGNEPTNPRSAAAPTNERLADGQHADHWTMCPGEIIKAGFRRPVRLSYRHIGPPGPEYPLRDLTDEEKQLYDDYVKFEQYPKDKRTATGRFWTQEQLDAVGKGCGTVTRMPMACAETYAAEPGYYGSTFCCGCNKYLPVGGRGEFVWDGTNDKVGT